jgi:stage III sporulation protein AH
MKIFVFRRWTELSKRKKIIIGLTCFGVLLILGGTIGLVLTPEAPSSLSNKNTLPVNAQVGDNGIQFLSETVKSQPQGEDYFVNYRLQREESRQEAKAMLSPLLNSSVTKTKEEAQQKWLELTHKIEKEGQIESLLKMKGFQDAVVDVNKNAINVIIFSSDLTPDEIRLIQDIVIQVANVRVNQIRISFKK